MEKYNLIIIGTGTGGGFLLHKLTPNVNPALTIITMALKVGNFINNKMINV